MLKTLAAVLLPTLALAGNTSRSVPVVTGGGAAVSIPGVVLPDLGASVSLPAVDVNAGLPDLAVPPNPALSQGAASAGARVQASSKKGTPAGSEALRAATELSVQPLEAVGQGKGGAEEQSGAGRELDLALSAPGSKDSGSASVPAQVQPLGGLRSYAALGALGLPAPAPNPAEYYEDAWHHAASVFEKLGYARSSVRFGAVTGNVGARPDADASLHFTFYASSEEGADKAPAVYVDYAPRYGIRSLKEGARVSRANVPVPVRGGLYEGVSHPVVFQKLVAVDSEKAYESARAALPALDSGVSYELRYEKNGGSVLPVYRFYDGKGNVAAVAAPTGLAGVVKAAPIRGRLNDVDDNGAGKITLVSMGAAMLATSLAGLLSPQAADLLRLVLLIGGAAGALTAFTAYKAGLVRRSRVAALLGLSIAGAFGSLLMGAGAMMAGMMFNPVPPPLPNPAEYYEDAYEYAVVQAEKAGYSRADVRFGGVTGTLPVAANAAVPLARHLMFTFYISPTKLDTQAYVVYVDYAPHLSQVRGRMGSVAASMKNAPVDGKLFDGVNAPAEFKASAQLAPEQALDIARAHYPRLDSNVSFKLSYQTSETTALVDPWYSFYDGRGNAVKVNARTASLKLLAEEPERPRSPASGLAAAARAVLLAVVGGLFLAKAFALPFLVGAGAVAVLAGLIVSRSDRRVGRGLIFAGALSLLGGAAGAMAGGLAGTLAGGGTFEERMQARFGRMKGVTGVSVEGRARVVIEFGDRASLDKARGSKRVPMHTQGARVITRLNAQAQAAERLALESAARSLFGALPGLESLKLAPEAGEPRNLALEFGSRAALDAARAAGLPKTLERLPVYLSLTPAALEAERAAQEKARREQEAADRKRRDFARRLRQAFPDAPGFIRAYVLEERVVAEFESPEALAAYAAPATFEGLSVLRVPVARVSVKDSEIEAAVKALAGSKGYPWSSTEYNAAYAGYVESLRARGANDWQLQRFSDLESLEPVRGGRFNPWSGD